MGVYHNDDGETQNTTFYNRYQWRYTQSNTNGAQTLTFDFVNKQGGNNGAHINANDWLYAIQIYNAYSLGLNA